MIELSLVFIIGFIAGLAGFLPLLGLWIIWCEHGVKFE